MGAAIAAGNQLENGIWALLVMAATMIRSIWYRMLGLVLDIPMMNQWPWSSVSPIATSRRASPTRLDRAVIIPAPNDFAF